MLNNISFYGCRYGLTLRMHMEFLINIPDMPFYRIDADKAGIMDRNILSCLMPGSYRQVLQVIFHNKFHKCRRGIQKKFVHNIFPVCFNSIYAEE